VTGWLSNLCHPNTYDFYNEKTGERKTVITTLLANINLSGKKFMNLAYDSLIQQLKDQHNTNLKLQAEGKAEGQALNAEQEAEQFQPKLSENVEIIDIRKLDDYSLKLSALLSAATDNAKELLLAKINAGPELAGTYIYLLQQGISFDDITNFMVSSTIDAIVKESKGNVFSSKSGSIDKAVKFFLEGANWRNFCSSSY
jgi:hypothetical protein